LKILICSLLIFHSCSIIKKSNFYNLSYRSEDFVILSPGEFKSPSHSINRIDKIVLKNFLNSIYYFKNGNIYSDKNYIFNSTISYDLIEKIYSFENISSFYIIFKREDPIAPYSRLYRTIFNLNFSDNMVQVEFREIEKNFIFGNQYNYSDWAIPIDGIECNSRNNIYYSDMYKNIINTKSEICSSNEVNKFFIYSSDKEFKNLPLRNENKISDRLKELEELRKNKLISEKEYIEIRNKILNNF
jgi:hypothetical protein